jgi:hypothetical protein
VYASAASPDNPFSSLWSELATARWLADVGLPLLAALIAIALSGYFVRYQINYSRELARAEKRATAAGALGYALIAQVDVLNTTRGDSKFWAKTPWPDFGAVVRAQRQASLVLGGGPALEDVVLVTRTPLWAWRTWQGEWDDLHGQHNVDLVDFGLAMDSLITPWKSLILRYAESLIQWDGLGELPRVTLAAKYHVPLPEATHKEELQTWRTQQRHLIRREALKMRALGDPQ